jgi:hypothetical protein
MKGKVVYSNADTHARHWQYRTNFPSGNRSYGGRGGRQGLRTAVAPFQQEMCGSVPEIERALQPEA